MVRRGPPSDVSSDEGTDSVRVGHITDIDWGMTRVREIVNPKSETRADSSFIESKISSAGHRQSFLSSVV